MLKYLKNLIHIIKHKYFVLLNCFKLGIPFRGLVHDLSKLLPSEFLAYAKFFFSEEDASAEFKLAWNMHQKRNKHHWQYWLLYKDGVTIAINIPDKYIKEMVADWAGAGWAITGEKDPYNWYIKNKDSIKLSKDTEKKVMQLLEELRK